VGTTVREFVEFWLENSVHADEQFGPRRVAAAVVIAAGIVLISV